LVAQATVEHSVDGPVTLVQIQGLVDEHFTGFGALAEAKAIVLDVSRMSRMTSFGVRQWRKAIDALPRSCDVYVVGCPTFFVDQLNMVLNFGGSARVLSAVAPYLCVACGSDSGEMIDVVAHRSSLSQGAAPERDCPRCGGKLELDETPESYFSFVGKYGATKIAPDVARVLGKQGLYNAAGSASGDKAPRIIKLVHGSVTYFRIIGNIGSMFRARPLLVGAEGEVVIDAADVEHVDAAGLGEWTRLLKTLSSQVASVTLVDISEDFLSVAPQSIALARNIAVSSVLVPYRCDECNRTSRETYGLADATWPLEFKTSVCSTCGGTMHSQASAPLLAHLQKASTEVAPASAKLIARRADVLSRAYTDANVARAGESATAAITGNDTILGNYHIVRPLSSGGMAEVFLAKQIGIGGFEKVVALKRIQRSMLQTRKIAIDMFLNEAKIAGRLMHPNIVQVIDVGEQGGALFLAMEYVRGRDLRDVVKQLRQRKVTMPIGEACYIIREIAQALHHAYWSADLDGKRLSVVHRDVSPHNVMLGFDGSVKLLDFGVALSAVTEEEQKLIVGKWLYMAPEAAANQVIDHRSDLFSLGVIAYLLCTSTLPFSGRDPKEIVPKVRSGKFVPVEKAAPDAPEPLAALITRMLAPDPADRPQTGYEVVAALNEVTRTHGIECSAVDISALLANLFPEEPGEAPPSVEIVRMSGQHDVPRAEGSKPRGSISPLSPDSESPPLMPDVSVTVAPRKRASSPAIAAVSPSGRHSRPSLWPSSLTPTATSSSSSTARRAAEAPPPPRLSTPWLVVKVLVLLAVLGGGGYFLLYVVP
jgi:eukaryotic-like serine/threonine-protein kinase